jgi:hypothetical protein
MLKRALFTKPRTSPLDGSIKFEENQEFRIAWIFQHSGYWQAVPDEPILVPVTQRMREACSW